MTSRARAPPGEPFVSLFSENSDGPFNNQDLPDSYKEACNG